MAAFKAILGEKPLEGKDGDVSVESLGNCDLVGLYFSAHWCPPCRGFTPVLANWYQKVKGHGKKFEIVFISSDRDEKSFKEYYGTMPWLALKYSERDMQSELGEKYGVRGIPTFVLLKSDGSVADANARGKVESDKEGKGFPWELLPASK